MERTFGPTATTSPQARRLPSDSRSTRMRSFSIFTGRLSRRDDANVLGAVGLVSARGPTSPSSSVVAVGSAVVSVTLRRYRSGGPDRDAGTGHHGLRLG